MQNANSNFTSKERLMSHLNCPVFTVMSYLFATNSRLIGRGSGDGDIGEVENPGKATERGAKAALDGLHETGELRRYGDNYN